ncbi:hypothetical protein [Clostridium sp. ZBS18]|uniref:hypothetical protein n=1 Tax=Clostridium sp. ZBS18 TaxID=2949967 RepID=UPI00207A9B97|nr:hypothetical protein [Clostridium sp. ZBS18]
MTREQNELFLKIIKKEEHLQYCYVSNKGQMFPPHYIKDGTMDKTGEQVCKELLENKNNPPKKEPTETEILQKQLLETQNMLLELQYKLTNKDLEIK